jgi:hypothetical protein
MAFDPRLILIARLRNEAEALMKLGPSHTNVGLAGLKAAQAAKLETELREQLPIEDAATALTGEILRLQTRERSLRDNPMRWKSVAMNAMTLRLIAQTEGRLRALEAAFQQVMPVVVGEPLLATAG